MGQPPVHFTTPSARVRSAAAENLAPLLAGDRSLAEHLGLEAGALGGLRAQAAALYEAGKWERLVGVLHGLISLGDVEPWDAVMLARAYDELGDGGSAALAARVAEEMLGALEAALAEAEGVR